MAAVYIRKAVINDLSSVKQIIDEARKKLRAEGSPQWQDGHPDERQLEQDLRQGVGYVLMADREAAGYVAVTNSPDPTYQNIYHGKWHNDVDPYVVIHRMAISKKFQGQHLSTILLSNVISLCAQRKINNVRFDTYRLNHALQHLGEKFSFHYCGEIKVVDQIDPWRLAYELNLKDNVN
ncbi:hypothetical protein ATO21_02030 [Pediococcus acidilactici]|uniref:GNAT family N-acetyltransferase n=1 Tax=Pediococcus acidilactici TaxID=1254 RepID=UPI00071AF8BE|nr:GNAT family N-acetyltransferase [Pediococcus acidilactici]KSV57065.1 hypothetical protein ATO21_02030 [Pediococcus acidilactici]